jgi:hypothetical protein
MQIVFFIRYRMSIEMQSVIHSLSLKNLTITEISREVDDVHEQDASCLRIVQKLVGHFAAREKGLEDRPRSDRPRSD